MADDKKHRGEQEECTVMLHYNDCTGSPRIWSLHQTSTSDIVGLASRHQADVLQKTVITRGGCRSRHWRQTLSHVTSSEEVLQRLRLAKLLFHNLCQPAIQGFAVSYVQLCSKCLDIVSHHTLVSANFALIAHYLTDM